MQPPPSPSPSAPAQPPATDLRLRLLREQITQAVADQLCRADFDWDALELLGHPSLRIEATLHDASTASSSAPSSATALQARRQRQSPRRRLSHPLPILSHVIDLTDVVSRSPAPTPRHVTEDTESGGLATPSIAGARDDKAAGTIVPARTTRQSSRGNVQDGTPSTTSHPVPARNSYDLSATNRTSNGDNDNDTAMDEGEDELDDAADHQEPNPRKAISGLRPSRAPVHIVEDTNTQRKMQVGDKSFPKRRKVEPTGYALKPSTLDKLIVGIWEQLHSTTTLDPQDLLGQFVSTSSIEDSTKSIAHPQGGAAAIGKNLELASSPMPGLAATKHSTTGGNHDFDHPGPVSFSHKNIFCRKVTQASRACRSIEVIVQARWVEHFEAHIETCKLANPGLSDTKHRKAALVEACHDFGWTEKELRNKMAVWRGYKEIKDAGGWSALVFAGMGIYRFCKYRIGFDKDSLQRLRNLRPALEVAADTMHPHWRQLLAVVDLPTQQQFTGHRHDWVIFPDGTEPVPLHTTYLQWDVNFSFKHIDESVVDEQEWGCDDPRWAPPLTVKRSEEYPNGRALISGAAETMSLPVCAVCDKEQSDDPRHNACMCFPSLFGCTNPAPSPVQVFRTKGRSNGLLALCPFERGAPVGEFVGVVTKGLENVDVMEGCTLPTPVSSSVYASAQMDRASNSVRSPIRASFVPPSLLSSTSSLSSASKTSFIAHRHHAHPQSYSQYQAPPSKQPDPVRYQIWQGKQGNFTRFVNHSCNANAQYQTFTWCGTQRIILVSKGIEAGAEVTVDYSDKYWKGLDKKCLCGERSCRYRAGGS